MSNAIYEDRFADTVAGACVQVFEPGAVGICLTCGHQQAVHPTPQAPASVYCTHCVLEAYLRQTRAIRDDLLVMLGEFRLALTKFYEYVGMIKTAPVDPDGYKEFP